MKNNRLMDYYLTQAKKYHIVAGKCGPKNKLGLYSLFKTQEYLDKFNECCLEEKEEK